MYWILLCSCYYHDSRVGQRSYIIRDDHYETSAKNMKRFTLASSLYTPRVNHERVIYDWRCLCLNELKNWKHFQVSSDWLSSSMRKTIPFIYWQHIVNNKLIYIAILLNYTEI